MKKFSEFLIEEEDDNPCWNGYEMIGMKDKNGKKVPNCVPKESLEEAEYEGRKVTLDKPFRTPNEKSKFAVYVKNDAGKVVIVRFGDSQMEIRRDDDGARASFRARHNCDDKKDKTTPGYWSCNWSWGNKSVSDMLDD